MGQRLTSQLRPLISNPTITQLLLPFKNHQVAHTVTLPNNPTPKSLHLNSLIKKSQTQETEEHPYSIISTAKSADRPPPTGQSPHTTPHPVIPYPPIKVKCKYTKRRNNNK